MAMINELTDLGWVGERNYDLDLTPHREVDGIVIAVEWLRYSVHLDQLKPALVNMEVVQLIGLVLDSPLLHRSEPDPGIHPVGIEGLAVDVEDALAPDLTFRKDNRSLSGDLSPKIGYRQQRGGQDARGYRFTLHLHRGQLGTGILIPAGSRIHRESSKGVSPALTRLNQHLHPA